MYRTAIVLNYGNAVVPSTLAVQGSAYQRARDAFRRNDLSTAVTEMERAVAAAPKDPDANSWLGFLLIRAGDPDRAVAYLETADRLRPGVTETSTNLANALLLRRQRSSADTKRALALLEAVAKKQPSSPDAHNSLGYAAWKAGDFRRAADAYRTVTRLRPSDAQAAVNYGLSLQKIGKEAEAAAVLRRATVLDPANAAAFLALGKIEVRAGRVDAAIPALETARRLDPANIELLGQLGHAYARAGREDEAQAVFGVAADASAAPSASPAARKDASLRYNQGVLLARLDRLREALAAYDKALAIDPRYYDALLNSGFVHFRLEDYPNAVQRFRSAVQSRPNVALGWKNLALALEKSGAIAEALAAWRKAVDADAGDYESRESLAAALVADKKDAEALVLYEAMGRLRPKSGIAHNAIGLIHARAGRTDAALVAFNEALAREPGFAAAHNNAGVVLERKGKINEAIAAYRKALAADPRFADAKANLARFGATTTPAPPATPPKTKP